MDVSPQAVAAATFKTVKKGFDPDEVRAFLAKIAVNLESSQQHAAAMEARARAAIAKMQELAQQASHATPPPPAAEPAPVAARPATEIAAGPDEAETISRTLLLAQRTADLAISDAKVEAEAIKAAAAADAEAARAEAARVIEEARADARQAKEAELAQADEAVQSLMARRDFLLGDVEHLEQHVLAQRERLRDAIASLQDLIERVPGGLGEMRRPLLSAAAPEPVAAPASAEPAAPAADTVWADEQPDQAAAISRPEPLVGLSPDQRSDLSSAWQAAEEADQAAVASTGEADVNTGADAGGDDDTQPVDVTPVEGQLHFERAQPDSFRIRGDEL